MSERLERWKARNSVQTDFGPLAVLIGVVGGLSVLFPLLAILRPSNFDSPHPWLGIAIGGALLCCALGLWNAKVWARWTAVGCCACGVMTGGIVALLSAAIAFYLLQPSVGRRFARAHGVRESSTR